MKLRTLFLTLLCIICLGYQNASAQVIYDAISDLTTYTTTTSTPHTFMGQAFNTSNAAGSMPQVSSVQVGMFVIGAQTFANVRLRLQIWGSFSSAATGATSVFSNPLGAPSVFNLGPVTTAGNGVFVFTLNFATPITLPSTSNLGITFNFQSSSDGVNFVDNEALATAMRAPTGTTNIPVGQNITTGTNVYYRNASARTDFNFNANDARVLTGQTQATDGLAFSLTAVPEPTTWGLLLGGAAFLAVAQRLRRSRKE